MVDLQLSEALKKVEEIIQEDRFSEVKPVHFFPVEERYIVLTRNGVTYRGFLVGVEVSRLLTKGGQEYEYYVDLVLREERRYKRVSILNQWERRTRENVLKAVKDFIKDNKV